MLFQDNQLTGRLPSIGSSGLQTLDLSSNMLTSSLPAAWSSISGLTHLSLDNNEISGSIPNAWQILPSILSITLDNNAISGTLPVQYSNLDTLQLFSARNNSITGVLHGAWKSMRGLTGLGLSHNLLEGSLPRDFSTMGALQALALGDNGFTLSIPKQWSGLSALRNLDLASNVLTGTIPLEWDNMALSGSLVNLWLYENNGLTGCFPSLEFAGLAKGPPGLVGSLFDTEGYNSAGAFDNTGYSGSIAVECETLLPERETPILLAGSYGLDPIMASSVLALWNSSTAPCTPTSDAVWPGVTCSSSYVTGISLPSQGLSGTLPASWSRLNQLGAIDLSSNSLRGTLPAQWSVMSQSTVSLKKD
jgi:Leucine-rich repeat (LRR) protein